MAIEFDKRSSYGELVKKRRASAGRGASEARRFTHHAPSIYDHRPRRNFAKMQQPQPKKPTADHRRHYDYDNDDDDSGDISTSALVARGLYVAAKVAAIGLVGGVVGARFGGNADAEKDKCILVFSTAKSTLDHVVSENQKILIKIDELENKIKPVPASPEIIPTDISKELKGLHDDILSINGYIEAGLDDLREQFKGPAREETKQLIPTHPEMTPRRRAWSNRMTDDSGI